MSIREEIIKATREIPDSVKRGSVQQCIRWKDTAVQSFRVASNPKSTEYELKVALNNLKKYQ
jgi:hypothetical protein